MAILQFLQNNGLNSNQEHTIDFNNLNAQNDFWTDNIISDTDTPLTLSRVLEEVPITVGKSKSDLIGINYCRLSQDDKWWYFFIINKRYINDNTTALTLKLDVMQTFLFDYTLKESFINREHQNRWNLSDQPIYNTKSEDLEIGSDYFVKSNLILSDDPHIWYYVYAKEPLGDEYELQGGSPIDPSLRQITYISESNPANVTDTQQTYSGYYVYLFSEGSQIEGILPPQNTVTMIAFKSIIEDSRVAKIVATRYIPKGIIYNSNTNGYIYNQTSTVDTSGLYCRACRYDKIPVAQTIFNMLIKVDSIENSDFAKEYSISDTVLKPVMSINNHKNINCESKLYTAPYSMFRLNIFNKFNYLRREYFTGDKKLRITQGIINRTNLIVEPLNYLGEANSKFSILNSGIDGEVNLRTDAWDVYQSQNSASINGGLATKAVFTGASLALGIATGGVGLAVAGGSALSFASQVADEMMKRQDIKNTPDEVNQASSDSYTPVLLNKMAVQIEKVEIADQYKEAVYNYFYRYGYKCNDFKIPDIKSRYYFNYIKTIGANIDSNIDNEYLTEVKNILDKGITFWHFRNANTWKGIENYEFENMEMSLYGGNN